MRLLRGFILLVPLLAIPSCSTVGFYTQAVGGQMEILRKSRPISPIIADPATDPKLRRQLQSVEDIRAFASDHLSLPGNESYGTYADLGRDYVTWVLYAAPEFSLKPKIWWYPTLGNLDYRGFFKDEDAVREGRALKHAGYDVVVSGVDAYSTLGWFHDPVLNCFVHGSDIDLAELIFHELTHRRLFRNGDTDFNESMATAFAEEGVKRWLKARKRTADLRKYEALLVKREQFYNEIEVTRKKLETLYASGKADAGKRKLKTAALQDLQDRFLALRRRWGGRGLESWLEMKLNNAHLVSIITYQKNTARFHRLLDECCGDPEEFFKRAEKLELPKENR